MPEHYSLEKDVTLPIDIKAKVKKIADKYHSFTKKDIVVTSGIRTSQSQADAMYGKLSGGDKLTVYGQQTAAQKIRKIYDAAVKAKKTKDQIIADIKSEIDDQIKKQIYISKHLRKGAIDVRSRDMSNTEKDKLKLAAKGIAIKVILETTPPHFHLQL